MASRPPSQVIAAQPSTIRASPVHLSVDPKSQRIAYAAGKSVFLRDIKDPSKSLQYTGHTQNVTVAKFSPSGYYVASGDVLGNVKIWSCDGEEQILKNEVKVISGRITDLSWDPDSSRIIAIGEGKDQWGHAFTMDSGNSVGEVSGHSSIPNAVAIKAQRPFRAATAGDDCTVVFYHGAPYKYNKSSRKHSKFVYDVKFSPDGSKLVSVGADAKIFVYDGKTGDNIMELVDANNGHKGSVFAVSWDASSKYIVTSSADQTVKVWDVESGKVLQTWQLSESSNVGGQQVGNIWIDDTIISLSLSGRLTYLARGSDKPTRVVNGHQKAITALTITKDLSTMYSGSYDASAYVWSDSYQASELTGATHTSQILHIAAGKDTVMSIGMDDTAKLISGSEIVASVSTGDQPKGVAYMKDDVYVIATTSTIQICAGAKRENDIKPDYQPSACAANDQYIAIGSENSTIYIYDTKLQEQKQLKTNRSAITALAISPDSKHLAAGDSSGKIILYSLETGDPVTTRWAFHVNRITALSFSPSGKKVVSASLDTNIYVWFIDQLSKKLVVKNAHQGGVTGAVWKSETDVISSGSDGSLKLWSAMS